MIIFSLFASKELQNYYEIVMKDIKNYGNVLAYASDELKNDREFVMSAIKKIKHALHKLQDILKDNIHLNKKQRCS